MPFQKLFAQERTPVCTAISVLTTVLVDVYLLTFRNIDWGPFGGAFALVFTGLVVLVGLAVNLIVGDIAQSRQEYWGGRIANVGITLWLLTIALWVMRNRELFGGPVVARPG
jgi:hypothetical protein